MPAIDQDTISGGNRSKSVAALWILASALACLSVTILNGGPLYYFDSGGYLDIGLKVLKQFGFSSLVGSESAASGDTLSLNDETVNGSRSAVYSVFTAISGLTVGAVAIPVLHTILTFVAVWLPINVANRLFAPVWSKSALFSVPILTAAMGALPFYIAYFMPDILTGVLLIVMATITVFGPRMTMAERAVAVILGGFAVVSHLSHLAIAGLMFPICALVSWIAISCRWWISPALVALILATGLLERVAFTVAAESVSKAEVTYYPFITARLIQDGVGREYLATHCPDQEIPTCALHEALSHSGDPMRFTASHIIFETSAQLGSYRLMPPDEKRDIANNQVRFFVRVFFDAPVATIGAMLKNTLAQADMNSIHMTVPELATFNGLSKIASLPSGYFRPGRLSGDRNWIEPVNQWHRFVYAASLVAIVALIAIPSRLPAPMRWFAGVLMVGVLVNAFVCGGISQPADRYGARVAWLLPFTAAVLFLFSGLLRGISNSKASAGA